MQAEGSILLAEDDEELSSMMRQFFARKGFIADSVNNGRDAIRKALEPGFDLIILDVMMPILDGFEVLRQIRKRSAIPVIMLTARTSQPDRIDGLNSGADDYLPKPCAPDELLARVRAVLRRSGRNLQQETELKCGSLTVKPLTRETWRGSEAVALTSIEFDILECLAYSMGRTVSRDALAAVLYQREANPFERSIDVHISHLRRKLDSGSETFIHTIRGQGYLLASRPKEQAVDELR
jgi:two-component system response regulator CpxR